MTDKFKDMNGVLLQGHIKITDPGSGEVLIDKRNAIHYENMSISLAESLSNQGQGMVYQMAFGNGGSNSTTTLEYRAPRVFGNYDQLPITASNSTLYSKTYEQRDLENVK